MAAPSCPPGTPSKQAYCPGNGEASGLPSPLVFLPPEESSGTCLFFSSIVDRTLLSRPHNPILKFHLQFDFFDDYYHCHIDTWLRYAVDRRAVELDFYFFVHRTVRTYHLDDPNLIFYDFPFSALRNGCVRVLKLWYCDLAQPANMSTMGLFSLRLLSFDQVFVTDEMVSDLIEGCPNIEDLVLQFCGGMKDQIKFVLRSSRSCH